VFIQYCTENLQIVPVFGLKALDVTPRIRHLRVAVDGAPWVCVGEPETPDSVAGLRGLELAEGDFRPRFK
jgi:Family of unknown function (DUF6130)